MLREIGQAIASAFKPKNTANDGYINFLANLGQTGQNVASGGGYINNYITRNPQALRVMYRTSFIVRRVCDSRAEDMTKAGIRIDSAIEPDLIDDIQRELNRLYAWQQIADTIRWAHLFGTAFIMPVIDGHDPSQPLRIDSIGRGQLTGFLVLDRWQVIPAWGDGRILTLGRDNGYPLYYTTISNGMGLSAFRIHHSRLFRIDATPLPMWEKYTENFFSASIVESILDRVKAFDQASASAAGLIEAARNDVIYTNSLPMVAGENAGLYDRLNAKFQAVMRFRSNNGLTILEQDERLERHTSALSGVAEVVDRMAQQVAGATEIPLIRLLGITSGGLNTGEKDILDTYYEDINRRQENTLRSPVSAFVRMVALSIGIPASSENDFSIRFNPLAKLSAEQRANVASSSVQTLVTAYDAGLINAGCAARELQQLTEETGYFSNISDEDIDELDAIPPRMESLIDAETKNDNLNPMPS